MKQCPNCGKPMRLVRWMVGEEPRREWRCQDRDRVIDGGCATSEDIPINKSLPVATIAEDMAQTPFSSSKEAQTRQAGFRRVAGSIRKLKGGQKYLSKSELKTLHSAAAIFERLGAAAERAKRVRKRLEEE